KRPRRPLCLNVLSRRPLGDPMGSGRVEKDSLGSREVPEGVYWGIQTLRARENFPVSGLTASRHLVQAYAHLKLACVRANLALGGLDAERGGALARAAEEMAAGKFDSEFVVDVFQAGAGTSFHMNVNEVLTNRALEILGHAARGEPAAQADGVRRPRKSRSHASQGRDARDARRRVRRLRFRARASA